LRRRTFIIFFSIVLSLYALINYYIFKSGWNAIPQNSIFKLSYIIIFLILSLSFIAGRFLERASLSLFSSILVWVGAFWLSAMVYFFFFSLFFDLFRAINYFVTIFPKFITTDYQYSKEIILLSVSVIVILVVIAGYLNAVTPRIRTLDISIPKNVGNLRSLTIAAASDIHLGTIICKSRIERIVNKINSLNADIVLLPGDVVDEDLGPVIKQNLGQTLLKLSSKYGTWAITGNHEYIGGAEPACKYLDEHHVSMLRDSYIEIDKSIYIIGREDRSIKAFTGKTRRPLEEIMQGIDRTHPVIMMDHQPIKLDEAVRNGIDLQLSGHTHHGQLWPFNFITKKVYELSYGYRKTENTHFYVSCGAGTWGPPIRTSCRPEIVRIRLTFKQN
jgi:predicted MPP superfamily phosphohydrolase